MANESQPLAIRDNPDAQRYEVEVDGSLALIDYRLHGDTIALVHTGVPNALEGKGIGSALARFALDDARARGLRVIPRCPFVAAYIKRHPEYADLQ